MISPIEQPGGPEKRRPGASPESTGCPQSKKPMDTANHFEVVAKEGKILVHNILVRGPIALPPEDAVNLGLWLVGTALQSDLPAVERAVLALKEILGMKQ